MGVYEKLGLQETMDPDGIKEQLFQARKKLISRQNSANLEKRTEAERLIEAVNVMDELVEAAQEAPGPLQLGLRTYAFLMDSQKAQEGLKRSLKGALKGGHQALREIMEALKAMKEDPGPGLYREWVNIAAACGEASAKEILEAEKRKQSRPAPPKPAAEKKPSVPDDRRPAGGQKQPSPAVSRPVQSGTGGASGARQGPVLVHKRTKDTKVPDLKDIRLNDLKTGGFPSDKLKNLPWKKIGIGAGGLLVLLMAVSLFGGRKPPDPSDEYADAEPEWSYEEEIEEPKEPELPDDTDATPAESFTYGDYDDGVAIQSFTGSEKEVIVPSMIGGKPVVRIESGAFLENTAVTSVIVKEGVRTIGSNAFNGCRYLEEVILPGSLEQIDGNAFADAASLSSLALLEGQQECVIESGAFKGCRSLKEVRIPRNYTSVGSSAFRDCDGLQTLTMEGDRVSIGRGAFQNCKSLQSVKCAGIIQISEYAFQECISLTGIELPEGLEYIGDNAFIGCRSLEEVRIPSTAVEIGGHAFDGAERLQRVEFAAGGQDAVLDSSSFRDCVSLREIEIPGNYVTVGDNAFLGCTSLERVAWASGTAVYANQVIGSNAFEDCSSLLTAEFTSSLSGIGRQAFRNCVSLQEIEIPEGTTYVEDNAFAGCSALRRAGISSTVERLGSHAFADAESLREVSFAEGKLDASIGSGCFQNCTSLEEISLPGNYTSIEQRAFERCSSLWFFAWEESGAVYENQTIGRDAFSGCENLLELHLSGNVGVFDSEILDGNETVTICAPEGSPAAMYAEEHGIAYVEE